MAKDLSFYDSNFKEVEGAYWFGPVFVCVHPLCFANGQERLEIGSLNLIYGKCMKSKRTRIFFLVRLLHDTDDRINFS